MTALPLALCLSATAFAANAGDATASGLQAQFKAHAAALKAKSQAAGSVDTTPPVLTRFSLSGQVDAQRQGAVAFADMELTDDLSGVESVTLTLTSPSGAQTAMFYGQLNGGEKKYAGHFAIGSEDLQTFGPRFTRFAEPGTWTVTSMFAADAAGNLAFFFPSQLAALGNTSVQVVNNGGYDIVPPTIVEGKILTRRVSLSTPPPGTGAGTLPFIEAALVATDAGNGAVSGPKIGSLYFCLPDAFGECTDSFELDGTADAPHLARTTLRMSTQLRADQTPGKYVLNEVFVEDVAGNPTVVLTNLQSLFPDGGVVDVEP